MSAASQYYKVTSRVGVPHRHEVEVTVPLVGPTGATGPAGAAGASAWNDITGKPSTFAPSAHASTHHTSGSDPITPANIGAAKDFTEIEILSEEGTKTTTLTTAQLPARVIFLVDAANEPQETINLPTPDFRQSGLAVSIKVQRAVGSPLGGLFLTVVHNAVTYINSLEVAEAEGSIDFVWNGYTWTYSAEYLIASFPNRLLALPTSSGTLALTQSADDLFRIVGSSDATKKVAFEVDTLVSTGTTRTLTVPNASGTLGWLQSVSSITVSTTHQLTAARNQRVLVNSTNIASGAALYLPSTGNAEGDRLEVACVGLTAGTLGVRTGQNDYTVSTSMGLNEQRTFIYSSGAWTLGSVESHTHSGLGPAFASSAFRVTEPSGLATNRLAFSLSGITAGATRTLTVPDASGRIQVEGQPIGNTTPAAGSFTTLNATGTTELVNGGTTAGPFRVYNTSSAANANFERGFMRWSSNVLQIGTEKAGTGSARALEFQTDGVTRMTIGATGVVTVTANQSNALTISGSNSSGFNGAFLQNTSNGSTASTGFTAQNNSTAALVTRVYSSGVTGVSVFGTALANFAGVFADGAAVAGLMAGTGNSTPIILGTNNIERVRITSGGEVTFGGTTASFPALKRSSTTLQVRLANDSAFAPFECAGLTLNGDLTASTRNIVTDTTTGTKIGTATDQKIGFFNATPVVQQAAVADATDAATTQARLNDLLARVRTLGLIAT